MTPQPKAAVGKIYCQECHSPIEKGEPYYNLSNHLICTICWSAPPARKS